eukprot:g265.t1
MEKFGYEKEAQIGYGSFSTVYKAKKGLTFVDAAALENDSNDAATLEKDDLFSPSSSIVVAVKEIHASSSPHRVANEIRHLACLKGEHNIVELLDVHRVGGKTFLVLPYFEHDNFRSYVDSFTLEQVRCYMRSLFEALSHVHRHGIIHRDVKPRNFLYSVSQKRGMLIDFGLAQGRDSWEPGVKSIAAKVQKLKHASNEVDNEASKNFASSRKGKKKKKNKKKKTKTKLKLSSSDFDFPTLSRASSREEIFSSDKSKTISSKQRRKSIDSKKRGNASVGNNANVFCKKCNVAGCPGIEGVSRAGTPGFRAPEVLQRCLNQTPAVDIWAAGVILASLVTRHYPLFHQYTRGHTDDMTMLARIFAFCGYQNVDHETNMCGGTLRRVRLETEFKTDSEYSPNIKNLIEYTRPEWIAKDYKNTVHACGKENFKSNSIEYLIDDATDLLKRCLSLNPDHRISAEEALLHPFLAPEGKVARERKKSKKASRKKRIVPETVVHRKEKKKSTCGAGKRKGEEGFQPRNVRRKTSTTKSKTFRGKKIISNLRKSPRKKSKTNRFSFER